MFRLSRHDQSPSSHAFVASALPVSALVRMLIVSVLAMLISVLSPLAHADLFKSNSPFGIPKREFLPVEEAFVPLLEQNGASQLSLRFDIEDGYYLYKDKFKFVIADDGVDVAAVELPTGKEKDDPLFGLTEVYDHDIVIPISLTRENTDPTELTLNVAYQGCAEDGICYPPMNVDLPIILAAQSAEDSTGRAGAATPVSKSTTEKGGADLNQNADLTALSETDSIAASLANKPLLVSLAIFFGFGLALSLTPCVFPMIPILSGILIGQGADQGTTLSPKKSFLISLAYVIGMAATYAIVGAVVGGVFETNLQAAFQTPWVLVLFSLVFVALALSMFGFYNIQLPAALQSRLSQMSNEQQGGTLTGALIMGILSAVIVGPCVAPPLAGALIYISQSGDALLGGLALFVMGLGMGVPLLLLGASAGKLLPKAGVWMNTVKHIFGVIMLGVAIWLLERILPAPLTLALWGLLLIGSAVYMGAFDTLNEISTGWQRLWKACGIGMVLYGSLLIIGSASGASDVFQPLKNLTVGGAADAHTEGLPFRSLKGLDGLQAALAQAKSQNKPLMLDFYADWCIECKRMEKTTFQDGGVQAALGNALVYQADVTANDDADQALLKQLGLYGPPAILFYHADGKEQRAFRVTGYANARDFAPHVQRALTP